MAAFEAMLILCFYSCFLDLCELRTVLGLQPILFLNWGQEMVIDDFENEQAFSETSLYQITRVEGKGKNLSCVFCFVLFFFKVE